MSRKPSLVGSIRYRKRCSCNVSCSRSSVVRQCNEYDPRSSLTITDFQIKIADDGGSSKSSRKTVSSKSSEISQPGSESTVFRQRSRESLHSDAPPPLHQQVNNAECVDICDLPIIIEETRQTSPPLTMLDSDSRCSVRDSIAEIRKRCHANTSSIIFDCSSRSIPSITTKLVMKRQENADDAKPVIEGETAPKRPLPSNDDEVSDDHRITRSKVAEPKYKLTDEVKRRITLTNPILSGHVMDHYFKYGKPPFRNYGSRRDTKTCRF